MADSLLSALGVVASVTGIVGFGFTIAAWRQAKGAKEAAKAARNAVRKGSATEDVQQLLASADELIACVQNGQIDIARLKARELISGLGMARQRWQEFFATESQERLESTAREASKVSRALSATPQEIAQRQDVLIQSCHKLAQDLSDEVGRMLRLLDRRESEW